MSAQNGDKSRFNRDRKQKIAKRKRIRELLHGAAKSADAKGRVQTKSVTA